MIKRPKGIVSTLVLFAGTGFLYGQGKAPPAPQQGTAPPPPGFPVPIDHDIWILVILGLCLGLYFLYKKKFNASAA